jgi:hypothetical protein
MTRKGYHYSFKMYCNVVARDDKGRVIYKKRFASKSFVANWIYWLYSAFANTSVQNMKTTSGASAGGGVPCNNGGPIGGLDSVTIMAGTGNANYGIVVGSGTSTPTINDFELGNQIQNGTGANQLQYGNMTALTVIISSANNQMILEFQRTFVNGSGASVTVTEVGLIFNLAFLSGPSSNTSNAYCLILHDLLPNAVIIPNGGSLSVTYEIILQN